MAPDPLRSVTTSDDTLAIGRLGAVLSMGGQPGPVALGPHGPHVATTVPDTRRVLSDGESFVFPVDVTRRSTTGEHAFIPRLRPPQVAAGLATFEAELAAATAGWRHGEVADAMQVLREPVARSTTEAVLGLASTRARDRIAELSLAWIDALAPVIARRRPPSRWSRVRRAEDDARAALEAALVEAGVEQPAVRAVELAAGIQVPVAAGAWLLVLLAENPQAAQEARERDLAVEVAWETLRLRPPTWITARMSVGEVALGEGRVPPHSVVLVSPLLLGRDPATLPPGTTDPAVFDPARWSGATARPGAWLPFGAGAHACPGRSLGLGQLVSLARWAADRHVLLTAPARIDQTRGIFPSPALLRCVADPPPPEE